MTAIIKNKNKPDKVQIAAYITKEVKATFLAKCDSKGTNGSHVIRQFIHEYIQEVSNAS